MPKLLLTARLEAAATVETQEQSTNGPTTTVLFTHLANNMSLTTFKDVNVNQSMFAVIVTAIHPDPMMTVLMVALLSNQM